MKKIKYIVTSLAFIALFSCTFENEDINNIKQEDIRPDQYMSGAMVMAYSNQARNMNILGNRFMQTWYGNVNGVTGLDKSSEYTLILDNSFNSSIWDNGYRAINNYHQILNFESSNYDNHKAIAYIMESFHMQQIVDLYGDCPYSQAFKGSDNITPAYDNDAQIYLDLIANLDTAMSLIQNADANDKAVASEDVIYGGNMASWTNFAKLVKIKLLLRQSGVAGSAPNGQAYATYNTNMFNQIAASGIPTAVTTTINPGYSAATAAQQNPYGNLFYTITGAATTFGGQQTASGYIAKIVNGTSAGTGVVDNRRNSWYVVDPASGNVLAANQGEELGYAGILLSKVKPLFNSTSAGVIMSKAEAHFLLAEAYEKGYLVGTPKTEFDAGITASFSFLGATGSATYLTNINTVPGFGWNGGNHIEAIMTQKWLATNGYNAIESYIDYTRTGYPNVPLATTATKPNRPYRLPYPTSELVANSANVPGLSAAQLFTVGPFWK